MKMEEFAKPNNGFVERLQEIEKQILDIDLEIYLLKELNKKEDDLSKSAERTGRITELTGIMDDLKKEKDLLFNSNSN